MDITLIVKASNQQFDDQTIKCEPSWTIRRLKGHLTEVYPGKPTTDEQKLIYSGQLLGDSVVLKDILRTYEGQQAHTVHLVFTPKNNRHRDFSSLGNSGGSSSSNKTMSPKSGSESGVTTAASSSRSGSDPVVRSPEPGTDGLRQRNVTGGESSTAAPAMNTTSPISPASADYIMGQHLAMQNWMQQAYMQYLNQYMNVISNGQNPQSLYASAPTNLTNPTLPQPSPQPNAALATPANQNPILAQTLPNLAYYPYLSTMNSSPMPSASSIPAPITSSGTIPSSPASPPVASSVTAAGPSSQPTSSSPAPTASPVMPGTSSTANPASTATAVAAAAAVEDTSAQAQPAPVAADAAAPAAAAAAAAPARRFPNIVVEEQENRDWLDIFFSMCRVGILMTVVYLYSSPTRCLTVFIIGILLYLYQIGFFRNNNTDRLERARQMVVQQMNNAHGIRPNGAGLRARAPLAPAAAEPAAAANDAQAPAAAQSATESSAKATADTDTTDGSKPEESSSSQDSPAEETPTTMTPAVEAHAEEQAVADPSEMVPEANRVNLNDVAAFLRTLVLSFFTSIIPDMPAA